MKYNYRTAYILLLVYSLLHHARAAEVEVKGLIDIRASSTDSIEKSYLSGGQGKFANSDGQQLSLSQAGLELSIAWENGLSLVSVLNGYYSNDSGHNNTFGATEAYLKYRSLPTSNGYRLQLRTGIFYPEISLENNAYAWASKDTLNSSTLNTWIGEEIRVLGGELKATRLGRFNNNKFDLSFSASLFVNNDPAGALLAWHGWTMSSRQTLWTEKQKLPWFPARNDVFASQASASDPFLEIDNKLGYHLFSEWKLHRKGSISLGFYDNRAVPYQVQDGQYGWDTQFFHAGIRWRLSNFLSLTAQYLVGSTLMQNPEQLDMVNNDYENGFMSLTYRWQQLLNNKKHKSTLRVEHFLVTDNDETVGDNNNEHGNALTINHTYRLASHWFISAEFNLIDSHRPARSYENDPIDLVERQYQLAVRYFY